MRKDSIDSEAYEKALQMFAERGLQIEGFTHTPTDYAKGTVMEPEQVSTLKASFAEYESLGKKQKDLTDRINTLNEMMKASRQRGAFQVLQDQMKEVKNLVKQREDIDAKMSVIDLARKKEDDRRIAASQETSYSEKINEVGERIAKLEQMLLSYSEEQ
jgi:coenzyme F420-reducing hydrogenase delta subunit